MSNEKDLSISELLKIIEEAMGNLGGESHIEIRRFDEESFGVFVYDRNQDYIYDKYNAGKSIEEAITDLAENAIETSKVFRRYE